MDNFTQKVVVLAAEGRYHVTALPSTHHTTDQEDSEEEDLQVSTNTLSIHLHGIKPSMYVFHCKSIIVNSTTTDKVVSYYQLCCTSVISPPGGVL